MKGAIFKTPSPHGRPTEVFCSGPLCLHAETPTRSVVYPGDTPRRWTREGDVYCCPRCSELLRRREGSC